MNVTITPALEDAGRSIHIDGKYLIHLDACAVVIKYTVYVSTTITYTSFDEAEARRFAAAYPTAEIFQQLTITTPQLELKGE